MTITTSTHRVYLHHVHEGDGSVRQEFFGVELVAEEADRNVATIMVDHVQVAGLTRWHDESVDAWHNRVNTTRDAVVATCERIAKELPAAPMDRPVEPPMVFPTPLFTSGGLIPSSALTYAGD